MTRSASFLFLSLYLFLVTVASLAAQRSNADGSASIPHLIRFSGVLKDMDGKPAQGTVGVTFALYKDEQGGVPLWMETQNVTPDASGHYSIMLGATKSDGLPTELFISKEARWLSVEPRGLPAPVRVLLLSVPYALKAVDAETIGGLPPSAFVLAAPAGSASSSNANVNATSSTTAPPSASGVTTSGGTVNLIPLWSTASDIENSAISQTGSGTTAKIGINTTTPTSTLDVKGSATVRGTLGLPAGGVATATAGKSSQPIGLGASSFNSSNSTAVTQTFQFRAEPAGNNTATPSGTLNLLFGTGTSAPTETGLKIASNGQIAFAAGQAFPGTGNGTITGLTAGTALTGGGTSGSVTLNVDTTKVVTGVVAGTGLTGGGTGGVPTLNLDVTKVPLLNAANLFTADQKVLGNVTSNGLVSGLVVNALTSFNILGNPFAFGSQNTANSYFGFAGNQTGTGGDNVGTGQIALLNNSTGNGNTADGVAALKFNTGGSNNSAVGFFALSANTSGASNTGIGNNALVANTTGSNNTALGANAGPDSGHPNLSNATAIGANAQVTVSNALILGSINGVNGASADTLVGIGTTAPAAKLDVRGTANFTGAITFAPGQTFPGTGTITGVTAGNGLSGGGTSGMVALSLNTGFSDGRYAQLAAKNTFTGVQVINNNVGIGISAPAFALHTMGTIRSEVGGLSVGGNAPVVVDAPGIIGGRFTILPNGNVGINNPSPATNLDIFGSISASGSIFTPALSTYGLNVGGGLVSQGITTDAGVSAFGDISAGGNLSVKGSLLIRGDTPMSAAPRMYLTGYVPGPMAALDVATPIFTIQSKNILITRMTSWGVNPCPAAGTLTFSIVSRNPTTWIDLYDLILKADGSATDSGPLSIAVAAGDQFYGQVSAPNCGTFGGKVANIPVSVEYVMQ